jgi:type I restriction enzyme M protein
MINRRTRELTQEDIRLIADTYHNWRNIDGNYKDIPGFCKSATIDEVTALDYVLTPGRYVGLPEEDDNFDFEERIKTLSQELRDQMDEAQRLDKAIVENLRKIGIEI